VNLPALDPDIGAHRKRTRLQLSKWDAQNPLRQLRRDETSVFKGFLAYFNCAAYRGTAQWRNESALAPSLVPAVAARCGAMPAQWRNESVSRHPLRSDTPRRRR